MFLPRFLQQDDSSKVFDLIREFPFASLIFTSDDGIEIDHLPLFVEWDNEKIKLVGHLAKVNSTCKKEIQGNVKVVFRGPDAYISPNWYPSKKEHGKAVPTWNYLVVHIEGALKFIHDEQKKYELLERQSHFHEQGYKEQWKLSDAPESYVRGMLKGIVGVEIFVTEIIAKWKVSKEKSNEDKQGIREGLSQTHDETAIRYLVAQNKA